VLNPNGTIVQQIKLKAEQTKGDKGRTVFLNDKLGRELASYIGELRKNDPCAPLISSQRTGKHFSNTTLCMLFTGLYAQAGMRNTSHAGRRTFATKLNAKGVGMRTIQKLMGHQHIATTALYCDVSDEQLYNAANLV
jgi:integrase/recombinase XerD